MDKKLQEKVDKILRSDYKVSFDDEGVTVEFWSPVGEDMPEYFRGETLRELAADAREAYEAFDADDHAAQIYHAMHYGTVDQQRFYAGMPESLEDLLEDAKAIKRTLKDIVDKLEKAAKKEGK